MKCDDWDNAKNDMTLSMVSENRVDFVQSDEVVMRKKPKNICTGINIRPCCNMFRDLLLS